MSSRTRRIAALFPVVVCVTAGCGMENYDERIKTNTFPFFSYQQELSANLAGRWRHGELSLRLPSLFTEVPGPKKKETGRDKRIPPQLRLDQLTGLLGGFRGEVQAAGPAGKPVKVPAFALVLSNRELLTSRNPREKPQDFDKTLLNRIAGGLDGAAEKSEYKTYPVGGKGFQPSHRFAAATVTSSGGGTPLRYEIYVLHDGKFQAAVVFAVPRDAERSERLRERIDLSLQTLRIDTAGSAAGGAPAAGSGSSPGGAPGF